MTEPPNATTVDGRIWFEGNPWPAGHRVVSCEIVGRIDPTRARDVDGASYVGPALSLSIELRSADYCEGDLPSERDLIGADDWSSKIAWNNYGAAWIGESASSASPGMMVSDGQTPFDFTRDSYQFVADSLPRTTDEIFTEGAYGCYILGHDACADHAIHLHSRIPDGTYTLNWTGRIAQAYVGKEDFTRSFRAQVTGVQLKQISLYWLDVERAKYYHGIDLDPGLTPREYFAPFVVDVDAFVFEHRPIANGSMIVAVPRKG